MHPATTTAGEGGGPEPHQRSTGLRAAAAAVRAADVTREADVHRATILAFLDTHPDALERSCVEGHVTGSAVVVEAGGDRTLLMLHRKLGRWLQPGGHADGDGELARVALREATEETGIAHLRLVAPAIDLDVHRVSPPGEQPHVHLDVRYLVIAAPGAVAVPNHESLDLRWITEDDLDDLDADTSTRRLVRRGLAIARSVPPDGVTTATPE